MPGSSPLKVLHVVHSLGVGGLENGVVNLINRLDSEKYSHVICCLTHSGKLAERLQSQAVEVVEVGLCADRFRFPLMKLRKLFLQFQPDIVHTRGWSTVDAILAGKLAGVKRVIHGEHGREAYDTEGLNWKRNAIRRALAPCVDRFVAVSEDLRRWLTGTVGISQKKVVTIQNGVDTSRFSADDRDKARRVMGLSDATVAIGIVGRLDPVKGHKNLLQAFAQISHTGSSAVLIVVGGGPLQFEMSQLAVALGLGEKVRFLGERHDVPILLKGLDVFALTSIAEGISNTILEAMATGLPVVATSVGGNPELVEQGITGQLVPAGDTAALSAALLTYLRNPILRQLHGRKARQRAVERFSLDRMARQYENLYLNPSQF